MIILRLLTLLKTCPLTTMWRTSPWTTTPRCSKLSSDGRPRRNSGSDKGKGRLPQTNNKRTSGYQYSTLFNQSDVLPQRITRICLQKPLAHSRASKRLSNTRFFLYVLSSPELSDGGNGLYFMLYTEKQFQSALLLRCAHEGHG